MLQQAWKAARSSKGGASWQGALVGFLPQLLSIAGERWKARQNRRSLEKQKARERKLEAELAQKDDPRLQSELTRKIMRVAVVALTLPFTLGNDKAGCDKPPIPNPCSINPAWCASPTPVPTPPSSPEPGPSPSSSPIASPTPTPQPSPTANPTPQPSASPSPCQAQSTTTWGPPGCTMCADDIREATRVHGESNEDGSTTLVQNFRDVPNEPNWIESTNCGTGSGCVYINKGPVTRGPTIYAGCYEWAKMDSPQPKPGRGPAERGVCVRSEIVTTPCPSSSPGPAPSPSPSNTPTLDDVDRIIINHYDNAEQSPCKKPRQGNQKIQIPRECKDGERAGITATPKDTTPPFLQPGCNKDCDSHIHGRELIWKVGTKCEEPGSNCLVLDHEGASGSYGVATFEVDGSEKFNLWITCNSEGTIAELYTFLLAPEGDVHFDSKPVECWQIND